MERMKERYIESMIEALERTFDMMFQMDAKVSERKPNDRSLEAPFEVSGVIGIAGPIRGSIVISFPDSIARQLTLRMLGEPPGTSCPDEDMCDCVGEIANIIAGNILPSLEQNGAGEQNISLPNVIVGPHRVVWRREDPPHVLMLFETELGTFGAGINLLEDDV